MQHDDDRISGGGDAVGARARRAPVGEGQPTIETMPDGSVVIPVLEEELIVSKRPIVRERIIVRKRIETVEQRVEEQLTRERVEIEGDDAVQVEGDVARTAAHGTSDAPAALQGLLTVDDIPELRNIPVVAFDGEELGRVGDVFYDEHTRLISSVGVARDRLGFSRLEVPIEGATLRDGALHLASTRAEFDRDDDAAASSAADVPEPPADEASIVADLHSVVRHEDDLQVRSRVSEIGTLRAHKHVESYAEHRSVQRTVEHFDDVERVAADADDSGEIEMLPDGGVSIPVIEEEVVVGKQTVIRERVVIRKEAELDRYRVAARLRRERVDLDSDTDTRVDDTA